MAAYQAYWESTARLFVLWFLFSLGLWKLSGKLEWKQHWMAWIPGLRYHALGQSLRLPREGLYCCLVELLIYAIGIVYTKIQLEKISMAMSLILLILMLLLFVYRIRLFLRLLRVFGLKKRWILLWLFADWLALLLLGFGKKYQPQELPAAEEWEAGTAPAEISGAEDVHIQAPVESGLSVDLYERTVKDSGKTRYLLKDISLNIPNGSLVLLLGCSGSGKTTFVNAVLGYEKAKAKAKVMLNGADIYRDYSQVKYRIGFVSQKNLLRMNDTLIKTVDDAAELRLPKGTGPEARTTRVQEVLDLLGLSAGAQGLVAKKSGGQLRRISIAMELVSDPELFVLDEPDSGLDGVIAREIFTKLRTIADEGKIVLVITHTPDRVIDLFDKVIILARDSGRVGRLAFYGSPQEAREFFGKDSMEGIAMSLTRKEDGGEGLADQFIERYAAQAAAKGGASA